MRNQPMTYAGIGSRRTPRDVLALMRRIAAEAAAAGWTLRTGGAEGADETFQAGAEGAGGEVELYLPWPSFRQREQAGRAAATLTRPTDPAIRLSARFHPGWARLGRPARALHARNAHQVLGRDLALPSNVIVCWTPDGSLNGATHASGGTGQALRLAAHHGVPVLNLARAEHRRAALAVLLGER